MRHSGSGREQERKKKTDELLNFAQHMLGCCLTAVVHPRTPEYSIIVPLYASTHVRTVPARKRSGTNIRRVYCVSVKMDREKRRLEAEAENAAENSRAQLSEANGELESLREVLLQSNAETRRWVSCWLLVLGSESGAGAEGGHYRNHARDGRHPPLDHISELDCSEREHQLVFRMEALDDIFIVPKTPSSTEALYWL